MKLASSTSAVVGRSCSSMVIEGAKSAKRVRKGERREANGANKRSTDGSPMDADVSMADVNITLDNTGPSDSGLKPRRRGMLPPSLQSLTANWRIAIQVPARVRL